MFKFVVLAALVCAAIALTPAEEFDAWATKYHKTYASEAERAYRMRVYAENKDKIERKNANSGKTRYGLNAFADRTHDELVKRFTSHNLKQVMKNVDAKIVHAPKANLTDLPDYFNWVDQGAVTSVKYQGHCSSCFAFGAVGCMEGQLFLTQGKLVELSEQNIVDCDTECNTFYGVAKICDAGCNGGMAPNAFTYAIKNNGINTNDDYPYTAVQGECQFNPGSAIQGWSSWDYVNVDSEDDLRQYLYDNGPVAIGAHADEWFYYSGGVFDDDCQEANDHAILLTGWGTDSDGTPYWIIKNSWGATWGQDGYIWLIRGKNKCGMLKLMSQIKMG